MEDKTSKVSQLEPNWSPETEPFNVGGTMLLAPLSFQLCQNLQMNPTQLHPAGAPDPRLRQQPATALGDIKNLSKIIEKSSKNPSKIYQNPSKINQKSIKIGSWAPRGPKTPQDPSKPENRSNIATNILTLPGTFWEAFPAMLASKSH